MPKAIGGFFELELQRGHHLYPRATGFNSARSAFQALLTTTKVRRVHLPFYICDVMGAALRSAGVEVVHYALSEDFELLESPALESDETLLYVNYFGLKGTYLRDTLAPLFGQQLTVDNSQGLFSKPLPGVATIYSPRKFVGVPDGGWLVNGPDNCSPLEPNSSQDRFAALLGRLEDAPRNHYARFQALEEALAQEGVRAMSQSTARILDSIDYPQVAHRRIDNLAMLHKHLAPFNRFDAWPETTAAALCYPLLLDTAERAATLRTQLAQQQIYVPCYWYEVARAPFVPAIEKNWANCLLPLPIDQRYGVNEMNRLVDALLPHLITI